MVRMLPPPRPDGVFVTSVPVLRRSIRESWRGLIGWSLGITALLFLYLPLFKSFGTGGQLQAVIDALPKELTKTIGYDQIATGAGYAQSTFYGLTGFVLFTIAAVIWSSAAIGGAEESGRLELDLAHPIARVQYALEQAAAIVVKVLWLGLLAGLIVWGMNEPVGLGIDPPHIIGASAALAGLGFLTASIGLLVGALTGRRSWASGAAAGIAVLGYVFQAVAKQSSELEWLNIFSPYAWVYHQSPLSEGVDLGGLALVWGFAIVFAAASAFALQRRDVTG